MKKIRRIPDGGGWKAWGRGAVKRRARVGYDYIHSAVDDHTRVACSEIHPDEQGPTAAGLLIRADGFFASVGINQIGEVMADKYWSYTKSATFAGALEAIGARHVTILPPLPLAERQSIERFPVNRMAYK